MGICVFSHGDMGHSSLSEAHTGSWPGSNGKPKDQQYRGRYKTSSECTVRLDRAAIDCHVPGSFRETHSIAPWQFGGLGNMIDKDSRHAHTHKNINNRI